MAKFGLIGDVRGRDGTLEVKRLLLELMLKIALPAIRKPLDSDSSVQPCQIIFLKSIKASDVGHTSLLLLSPD